MLDVLADCEGELWSASGVGGDEVAATSGSKASLAAGSTAQATGKGKEAAAPGGLEFLQRCAMREQRERSGLFQERAGKGKEAAAPGSGRHGRVVGGVPHLGKVGGSNTAEAGTRESFAYALLGLNLASDTTRLDFKDR